MALLLLPSHIPHKNRQGIDSLLILKQVFLSIEQIDYEYLSCFLGLLHSLHAVNTLFLCQAPCIVLWSNL